MEKIISIAQSQIKSEDLIFLINEWKELPNKVYNLKNWQFIMVNKLKQIIFCYDNICYRIQRWDMTYMKKVHKALQWFEDIDEIDTTETFEDIDNILQWPIWDKAKQSALDIEKRKEETQAKIEIVKMINPLKMSLIKHWTKFNLVQNNVVSTWNSFYIWEDYVIFFHRWAWYYIDLQTIKTNKDISEKINQFFSSPLQESWDYILKLNLLSIRWIIEKQELSWRYLKYISNKTKNKTP
jgi:hypothetical protein